MISSIKNNLKKVVNTELKSYNKFLEGGSGSEGESIDSNEDEDLSEQSSSDDEEDLVEIDENVNEQNRMNLLAFSKNNQYFLFEDKLKKVFKIYKLVSIQFQFLNIKQKIFQFVPDYEVKPPSM